MRKAVGNNQEEEEEEEDLDYSYSENDTAHDNNGDISQLLPRYEASQNIYVTQTATIETQRELQDIHYNSLDEMEQEYVFANNGNEEFRSRNRNVHAVELPSISSMVVDCVPPRSDFRVGDASTVAAADPSDLVSDVDDLAPEEQDYGPVVDVTPFVQPLSAVAELPSGAGSTSVFAPQSIAADDLDEEDSVTLSQGEQKEEEWDGRIKMSEDDEPNPQSGNEEPILPPVDEQLVDFLPPVNDNPLNDGDDVAREGLSEMTVGGAQSFLQTGDPIEEDFGPVVDLTPFLPSDTNPTMYSLDSDGAQAVENNEETDISTIATVGTGSRSHLKSKVVVDPLPKLISNKAIDSTATAGRSESTEEEEDDASNRFGPVVDQLPTSRAWLVPSRGGSTVDALANVSEANSDEDDNEEEDVGWDDVEYDASLGGVSEGTGRYGMGSPRRSLRHLLGTNETDKIVTVRFDSSVTDRTVAESDNRSVNFYQPRQYDYVVGTSSTNSDLISGSKEDDGNGIESLNDNSFAHANTPLSTPGRNQFLGLTDLNQFSLELPTLGGGASLPSRRLSSGYDSMGYVSYTDNDRPMPKESNTIPYSFVKSTDMISPKEELNKCRQNEEMLKRQLQQLRDERHKLHGENSSLNRQLDDCQQTIASLRDGINVLEKRDTDQQESINALQGSLQKSKDKVRDLVQVAWELARLAIANIPAAQNGTSQLMQLSLDEDRLNSANTLSRSEFEGRVAELSKVVARLQKQDLTASPGRNGRVRNKFDDEVSMKGHEFIDDVQQQVELSSIGASPSSRAESDFEFAQRQSAKPVSGVDISSLLSAREGTSPTFGHTLAPTVSQLSKTLDSTKDELEQATKRISELTESETHYAGKYEAATTLAMELENKLKEKQQVVNELESTVCILQGELTAMTNSRKSETAEIVSLFNQETQLLTTKLRNTMDELKEREDEVISLQHEVEKLRRYPMIEDKNVVEGSLSLSITGVTIRSEEERSNAREELLLSSKTNKEAMCALQQTMKNYLDSI